MLYAILCYADEETVFAWSKEEEAAVMGRLYAVQEPLAQARKLGPTGRLMPTTAATTVRKGKEEPIVLDGPFAETKEALGGYYLVEAKDLDEAIDFAARIPGAQNGSIEVRPIWEIPDEILSAAGSAAAN